MTKNTRLNEDVTKNTRLNEDDENENEKYYNLKKEKCAYTKETLQTETEVLQCLFYLDKKHSLL